MCWEEIVRKCILVYDAGQELDQLGYSLGYAQRTSS